MSKQEEANLILKLYELRREETMRKARDWYFREFNPETKDDVDKAMFGPNSAYLRMVTSYWDMAAALVNHGAISVDLFNDTQGEYLGVFAKLEPLLSDLRAAYGPYLMVNLEKVVDATADGRQRVGMVRERFKAIRAQLASQQPQTS